MFSVYRSRYFLVLLEQQGPLSPEEINDAVEYFKVRGGLRSVDWALEKAMKPVGVNGMSYINFLYKN
jgi:hypothetical protein